MGRGFQHVRQLDVRMVIPLFARGVAAELDGCLGAPLQAGEALFATLLPGRFCADSQIIDVHASFQAFYICAQALTDVRADQGLIARETQQGGQSFQILHHITGSAGEGAAACCYNLTRRGCQFWFGARETHDVSRAEGSRLAQS